MTNQQEPQEATTIATGHIARPSSEEVRPSLAHHLREWNNQALQDGRWDALVVSIINGDDEVFPDIDCVQNPAGGPCDTCDVLTTAQAALDAHMTLMAHEENLPAASEDAAPESCVDCQDEVLYAALGMSPLAACICDQSEPDLPCDPACPVC